MNFVTYFRVSTHKQGHSGLGLEAQRAAADAFLLSRSGKEIATFTEIESGRNDARPELEKATLRCRQTNSTLLVAKLDRLSRNAVFLLKLRDLGMKFVAADMPDANELTIGLMALIAQHEREAIAQRTRAALAAAKARGIKLGSPKLRAGDKSTARVAAEAAREKWEQRAEELRPIYEATKSDDPKKMLATLEFFSVPAPRGGAKWDLRAVKRLMSYWKSSRELLTPATP